LAVVWVGGDLGVDVAGHVGAGLGRTACECVVATPTTMRAIRMPAALANMEYV